MTVSTKAILVTLGAAAALLLLPWRQLGLLTSLAMLAPLAGLWLLMHAMRLEMAIRLTVGVGLSLGWIAIFGQLHGF